MKEKKEKKKKLTKRERRIESDRERVREAYTLISIKGFLRCMHKIFTIKISTLNLHTFYCFYRSILLLLLLPFVSLTRSLTHSLTHSLAEFKFLSLSLSLSLFLLSRPASDEMKKKDMKCWGFVLQWRFVVGMKSCCNVKTTTTLRRSIYFYFKFSVKCEDIWR